MNDDVAAALFARLRGGDALDGAAAEPLGVSWRRRFSTAYAASEAITAPPPGSTPRKKPMTEPRPMAPEDCRRSLREGQMLATAAGTCTLPCRSSRL